MSYLCTVKSEMPTLRSDGALSYCIVYNKYLNLYIPYAQTYNINILFTSK